MPDRIEPEHFADTAAEDAVDRLVEQHRREAAAAAERCFTKLETGNGRPTVSWKAQAFDAMVEYNNGLTSVYAERGLEHGSLIVSRSVQTAAQTFCKCLDDLLMQAPPAGSC